MVLKYSNIHLLLLDDHRLGALFQHDLASLDSFIKNSYSVRSGGGFVGGGLVVWCEGGANRGGGQSTKLCSVGSQAVIQRTVYSGGAEDFDWIDTVLFR